jgi:hypothetical protein
MAIQAPLPSAFTSRRDGGQASDNGSVAVISEDDMDGKPHFRSA